MSQTCMGNPTHSVVSRSQTISLLSFFCYFRLKGRVRLEDLHTGYPRPDRATAAVAAAMAAPFSETTALAIIYSCILPVMHIDDYIE